MSEVATTTATLEAGVPNFEESKSKDKNALIVSIDEIDASVYKNPREKFSDAALSEMQLSIANEGQKQNILGTFWHHGVKKNKLAVYAGWTRYEAITRNTYAPLIKKWNEMFPDNLLHVGNPEHRRLVRERFPDSYKEEAEKDRNQVRITFNDNVRDEYTALVGSILENRVRTDLTMLQNMNALERLCNAGMKAKDIASSWGISEPQVSNMRKCRQIPDVLREVLTTPDSGENFSDSDLAKLKEKVGLLCDELVRRMDIDPKSTKDQDVQVSISHLKEFAGKVMPKKDSKMPISRQQAMDLLCGLVGADPKTLVINQKKPPTNYGIWCSTMESYVAETKARRDAELKKEFSKETSETEAQEGSGTGTIDGLVAQQATATEEITIATPEVSTGNSVAEMPAPAVSEDEAVASELNAAATISNMIGDIEVDESVSMKGIKSTRTQQAPSAQVKVKETSLILSRANSYLEIAVKDEEEEQTKNLGMIAGSIAAAAFGYEMLSMTEIAKGADDAYVEYAENLELYISALEEYANNAQGAVLNGKKLKPFGLARPTVDVATLGDAASMIGLSPEDDEDDGEGSDNVWEEDDEDVEVDDILDGVGEDSEDLASLEGMVGSEE